MSALNTVSLDITITVASQPPPKKNASENADELRCVQWSTCENPRCFQHGCLNIASKSAKGVRHV